MIFDKEALKRRIRQHHDQEINKLEDKHSLRALKIQNRKEIEKLIGFKLSEKNQKIHSDTINEIVPEEIARLKRIREISAAGRSREEIHFAKEIIARPLFKIGLPSDILFEYIDAKKNSDRIKAEKKIKEFFRKQKEEYKKDINKTNFLSAEAEAKILKDDEI